MRQLLLLRHSKAAPADGRADFDRELTESGRNDARAVGEYIATRGLVPELVVFSAARRTRETAEVVLNCWPRKIEAVAEEALYDATRYDLLARVRELPEAALSALIVGHNPAIAEVANQLIGAGARDERAHMSVKYPTSALAVIEFASDAWTDVGSRSGKLATFVTPGDLGLR